MTESKITDEQADAAWERYYAMTTRVKVLRELCGGDGIETREFGRKIVKLEAAVDLDAMIHEVRNSGGIMLPDEVLVTRRIRDMGLLK